MTGLPDRPKILFAHAVYALAATARAFKERYQNTPWAKKASVWG